MQLWQGVKFMKIKTLMLYIKILFSKRKISIIYLLLNSLVDFCYNMTIVFIPSLFVKLIMGFSSLNEIITVLFFFSLSVFMKMLLTSKIDSEKEIQDQILIMAVTDKMNKIPYYYLEKYDVKKKRESCIYAIQNYGAAYDLYSKCTNILTSIFTLVTLFGLSMKFKANYMIINLIISFIYMYIEYRLLLKKHNYSEETINLNYYFSYFQELAIQKKYQINNKIYHYSDYLLENFKNLNLKITNHFNKIRILEANYESLLSIFSNVQKVVSFTFPLFKLMNKQLVLNEFVLLSNCGIDFSDKLNTISSSFQGLINAIDYLIPLYELMNIPDCEDNENSIKCDSIENIIVDNVSFKYPDCDDYVLENLNLRINKGEKIAIIGLNGSGKTTLIKLLLKLYEPTRGYIFVNGNSISKYDDSYINNISIVFQDNKVFPITVYENIVANKITNDSSLFKNVCHITAFEDILSSKKIDHNFLCNSEIYKNGVEFSGGEKQLLTITRASYRDGELFILDEPSSALDPLIRCSIIEKFSLITKNKTTILITHDKNLAKKCDKIIKIENKRAYDINKDILNDEFYSNLS